MSSEYIMKFDDKTLESIGGVPALATIPNIMRYVAGCMKRERERLAKAVVASQSADALAKAILDDSEDMSIFRWKGPGTSSKADGVTSEET